MNICALPSSVLLETRLLLFQHVIYFSYLVVQVPSVSPLIQQIFIYPPASKTEVA